MLLLKELPITQKTRYNFYTSTVKRDKRVHKEDADYISVSSNITSYCAVYRF